MPGVFESILELSPAATQRQVQEILAPELDVLRVLTSEMTCVSLSLLVPSEIERAKDVPLTPNRLWIDSCCSAH